MPFLAVTTLILSVAILFYAFWQFDRLLRTEYEKHRLVWDADGKPPGFFWRADECDPLTGNFARSHLCFVWLFRTPDWIAGSPELVAALRRLRITVLIYHVACLAWFALLFSGPLYG